MTNPTVIRPDADIGATAGEAASRPALLFDLATALIPRRLALARGLIRLIPGALEKVWTRWETATAWLARIESGRTDGGSDLDIPTRLSDYREAMLALAYLEDAVFALVSARVKAGARSVEKGAVG